MTVFITYSRDAGSRFDRKYYRDHHLPLVMKSWTKYGLLGLAALYPEKEEGDILAVCICRFRDDDAATAAFHSAEAERVMDDVRHFTDVNPSQSKSVPLLM